MPVLRKGLVPDLGKGLVPDLRKGLVPDLQKGLVPDLEKSLVPDLQKGLVPDPRKGLVPDLQKGLLRRDAGGNYVRLVALLLFCVEFKCVVMKIKNAQGIMNDVCEGRGHNLRSTFEGGTEGDGRCWSRGQGKVRKQGGHNLGGTGDKEKQV